MADEYFVGYFKFGDLDLEVAIGMILWFLIIHRMHWCFVS